MFSWLTPRTISVIQNVAIKNFSEFNQVSCPYSEAENTIVQNACLEVLGLVVGSPNARAACPPGSLVHAPRMLTPFIGGKSLPCYITDTLMYLRVSSGRIFICYGNVKQFWAEHERVAEADVVVLNCVCFIVWLRIWWILSGCDVRLMFGIVDDQPIVVNAMFCWHYCTFVT